MSNVPRLTVYLLQSQRLPDIAMLSDLTRYDLATMARSCHIVDEAYPGEVARLHRGAMTRIVGRIVDHPDYGPSLDQYRAAMDAWAALAAPLAKTDQVGA